MSENYYVDGYIESGYYQGTNQTEGGNYYVDGYIVVGYYEGESGLQPQNGNYFVDGYIESGYYEGEQQGVTAEAAAELEAETAVTVLSTVFVPAQADLVSDFAQSITETRVRQLTADFDALFSPNVTVSIRKNAVAILDAVASTETAATLIADIDKTLESLVNLDLQAAKFAGIQETLPASTQLSADALRIRAATAQLNTESNLDIEFIVEYSAIFEAESTAFARPTVFQEKENAVNLELLRYNNFGSFSNDAAFNQALVTNAFSDAFDYREYSNILFDGVEYVFINRDRFTVKSSDTVNWSTSTPQFPNPVFGDRDQRLEYQDGFYLLNFAEDSALISTDAVNWSAPRPMGFPFAGPECQKIIYLDRFGGYWYVIRFETNEDDSFKFGRLSSDRTGGEIDDPNASFTFTGVLGLDANGQGAIHSAIDNATNNIYLAVASTQTITVAEQENFSISKQGDISDPSGIVNFFFHNSNMYIASQNALYKSTDNGVSWNIENSYTNINGAAGSSYGVFVYTYDEYPRIYLNNTEIQDINIGVLGIKSNPVFSLIETTDDDRVFVTGDDGRILEYNGTGFDLIETPASAPVANVRGDLSTAKQIEFFTKTNHTNTVPILWSGTTFEIKRDGNRDESLQRYNFVFGSENTDIVISKPFDSYTHIKLLQDSSGTAVYIDGNRVITNGFTNTIFANNNFNIGKPDRNNVFIDELRVTNLADNPSTNTTTTVPQTDLSNTENTLGLFKFDNTFEVEQGFALTADADLNSILTFNAVSSILVSADADIQSSFQVSAEPGVIKQQTANIDAEFASSATATRAFALESAQTAQFVFAANADLTKGLASDLTATAQQTTQPTRIKQGDVNTDSIATALAAVAKVGQGLVTLETQVNLDADTTKTTGSVIQVASQIGFLIEFDRFRATQIDLNSNYSIDLDIEKIQNFELALETETQQTTVFSRRRSFGSNLDTDFAIDVDANAILSANAIAETNADFEIFSIAFDDARATLDSNFVLKAVTKVDVKLDPMQLNTEFVLAATAREFVFLNDLVYEIRGEDRTYTIPSEQRTYTILEEDRIGRIL